MKFSIVVPVAIGFKDVQRAQMLADGIANVASQTHQDLEVIIKNKYPDQHIRWHSCVDEACKLLGRRLNYIACEDDSMTAGINQGMWWADGDIIHIMCGDDMIGAPDTLNIVHDFFLPHPVEIPRWLYGSTKCINEDGSEGPWGTQAFESLQSMLQRKGGPGTPSIYWNQGMRQRLGYFKYELASDFDYWMRCYRICVPMYSTMPLGCGRRWSKAASQLQSGKVEREAADIAAIHILEFVSGLEPENLVYEACEH